MEPPKQSVCIGAVNCRSIKRHHYSLVDIDPNLEHIPELAESLGVGANSIMLHILTALKLKLNYEVKKTSPEKRQRLLEYLFPYAVLDDYSPLVRYLLEKEEHIPEVVVEKLLHEKQYAQFLTPSIKVNIYKQYREYFAEAVRDILKNKPITTYSMDSVFDRCAMDGSDKCRQFYQQSRCPFHLLLIG